MLPLKKPCSWIFMLRKTVKEVIDKDSLVPREEHGGDKCVQRAGRGGGTEKEKWALCRHDEGSGLLSSQEFYAGSAKSFYLLIIIIYCCMRCPWYIFAYHVRRQERAGALHQPSAVVVALAVVDICGLLKLRRFTRQRQCSLMEVGLITTGNHSVKLQILCSLLISRFLLNRCI